jgi:hypothetical protein
MRVVIWHSRNDKVAAKAAESLRELEAEVVLIRVDKPGNDAVFSKRWREAGRSKGPILPWYDPEGGTPSSSIETALLSAVAPELRDDLTQVLRAKKIGSKKRYRLPNRKIEAEDATQEEK